MSNSIKLVQGLALTGALFMVGCAGGEGYRSSYPDLNEYKSETGNMYLSGTKSNIKRTVLAQKTYVPATEDIVRAEKRKESRKPLNFDGDVRSHKIGSDEYVNITGEKNGAVFHEAWKNAELVQAHRERTVEGVTSNEEKYRFTLSEDYYKGDYTVNSYGQIGTVFVSETWKNGELISGDESFSVLIVDGVLKTDQGVEKESAVKVKNTPKAVKKTEEAVKMSLAKRMTPVAATKTVAAPVVKHVQTVQLVVKEVKDNQNTK